MPRPRRSAFDAFAYHVFNRGHEKRRLFLQAEDYKRFLALLKDAPNAASVSILAYCLLPNHWHLVVVPNEIAALSAYMQWVTGQHGLHWRRQHRAPGVCGPVYQGRFRSVPIDSDRHLLTALRYVEANPVRAGLVRRAGDWVWSSVFARDAAAEGPPLSEWPWPVPTNWSELLDLPQEPEQLDAVRQGLARSRSVACLDGTRGTRSTPE